LLNPRRENLIFCCVSSRKTSEGAQCYIIQVAEANETRKGTPWNRSASVSYGEIFSFIVRMYGITRRLDSNLKR
jgi:hypothetical protein